MANEVKAAVYKLGLDFAGYVRAEKGVEHLRYDQLILIARKGIQELVAANQALLDALSHLKRESVAGREG
ncbi:MAG TPA: hypothetical protein VL358_13870 [Caulobacteraceae bacterium]|jgi:hypothetical protein|nr:hypothetical protein [Caulobacteraceae bacterium]